MARTVDVEKQNERREAILVAAAACFAERGFHATSTAEICARAEISSGNLFHYFPTKRTIILALVERSGNEIEAAEAELAAEQDPLAGLRWLIDEIAGLAADPAYSRLELELHAEAHRDPEIAALLAVNDARLRRLLAGLVGRARAQGRVDPAMDPEIAATWIAAIIDGFFARIAADPDFVPAEQREPFQQVVLRFLGAAAR